MVKLSLGWRCQEIALSRAKEFDLANKLNSMARQARAERAWAAITRFYEIGPLLRLVKTCRGPDRDR
jgi:hypothetical protein